MVTSNATHQKLEFDCYTFHFNITVRANFISVMILEETQKGRVSGATATNNEYIEVNYHTYSITIMLTSVGSDPRLCSDWTLRPLPSSGPFSTIPES